MNQSTRESGKLATDIDAPVAKRQPLLCSAHGQQWHDDYAWLRADNWQQAMRDPSCLPAEIADYLGAENNYYDYAMAPTRELQKKLVAEMRGRIVQQDESLPSVDGPWLYRYRYNAGQEYPVYFRTRRECGTGPAGEPDGEPGAEQLMLDVNAEAADEKYFELGLVEHSPDHATLAWSCDTSGAEFYSLRFRTLQTTCDSDYTIADVETAAWADANTLYYTRVDHNHRATRVYRHKLGTAAETDELIYQETDERFECEVWRTRSGRYVVIHTGMSDQDEVWTLDCNDPSAKPQLVERRCEGLEYSIEHRGEDFLILTNADGATDFKLMRAPVASPCRQNWSELIAHQPGRLLLTVEALQDWIIWMERENALPSIVYCGDDWQRQVISFDEPAYALGLDAGVQYDSDRIELSYTSPTTPDETFEYSLTSGARKLLKRREIPSGHNVSHYVTRRILVPSHDGAEVPVTILQRADLRVDSNPPVLLYGYGSYGSSMPASFSANRLSLVDRGFVYAIAHVRGGEEKGRDWYEAARFERKVNSFHDFIAVAEALREQYSNPQSEPRIVMHGGSAGGLLVAATVNMRPDLFAGVIADVPFVDVLNTMLDDSLPLTPGEWAQWGNPLADPKAFEWLRDYSPYDNIEARQYPPMLVTAGVSDPRVTYWEPAKYVARLRATKTDDNILLLKTNMRSGHFGVTGRFAALEDTARNYAFAIAVTASVGED